MSNEDKRTIWDKCKSGIIITGAIFTMFGMFFGAFQFIDQTYAKDNQLIFLNHKVDVKILDDRINKIQDRLWVLGDRLALLPSNHPSRQMIQEQIRESTARKNRLDDELQIVIEKYKQAEEDVKH
jgi:hypothetical protein